MRASTNRSVAAVGDVTDIACWSGIPFYFWKAARAAKFAEIAWRLDMGKMRVPRMRWNAGRVLRGLRPGGFQYSDVFRKKANAQIPPEYFGTEVITFHQHYPVVEDVLEAGGRLNHYLDATFASMTSNRGLNLQLPQSVVEEGREKEKVNYATSDRLIAMARWTAKSLIEDCIADPRKVATILPGANLDWDNEELFRHESEPRSFDRDREFILGFVGMDWKRKGLEFLISVRDELVRRSQKVLVVAAGNAPSALKVAEGIRFMGAVDKRGGLAAFKNFLINCDIGCLFSENEALGISTLEFLRAGVPVAGFAHQGLDDTLPPDAGFRFKRETAAVDVADVFEEYLKDAARQEEFRRNALRWSPLVTWDRCVTEMQELWKTGTVQNPVRPWLGLGARNVSPGMNRDPQET